MGRRRRRPRPWRRFAAGLLAAGAAAALGWWWWLARLPRPDLLRFAPARSDLVIQLRRFPEALAAARARDPRGLLTGPRGLLARKLKAQLGSAGRPELIAELARDEALAALLPGGAFVIAARTGAREEAANLLLRGFGVGHERLTGGERVRRVRLPDGTRLAYALAEGTLLLSTAEGPVREALSATATGGLSGGLAASLPGAFDVRILVPRAAGAWVAGFAAQIAVSPLAGRAVLAWTASAAGRLAPALGGWPAAPLGSPDAVPADALLTVGASRLAPVLRLVRGAVAREPGWWRGADRSMGLARELDRMGAGEAAVSLLGVDRRGIIPMPQLAGVFGAPGPPSDAPFVARVNAAARGGTKGVLEVVMETHDGRTVSTLNFPLTRTLGPSLARAGEWRILGSSLSAAEAALDALGRRVPALAPRLAPAGRRPVHLLVVANLPGLASELVAIEAGLDAYHLLTDDAKERYARDVAPWLPLAPALGTLAASVTLDARELRLAVEPVR